MEWELVLFAIWSFTVALAGGVAGLVLGNMRLPATLLLSSSPAAGAGANIAISALAAGSASVVHLRAKRINWRLFAWMGPPSVIGGLTGGYLSGAIPGQALLLIIATVLLYSGIDLLRRPLKPKPKGDAGHDRILNVTAAVISAAIIGLLGGVVGLMLGTLRLPAMLRAVGELPERAIGTNSLVGLTVGVAGLLGHLPNAAPDAGLILIGAVASIPGAVVGAHLTGRLSEQSLIHVIAAILLVASVGLAADAIGSG